MEKTKKYSHVFWDWNGTLLDDLNWSFHVLNTMLKRRKLNTLHDVSAYHEVFGFPIIDYYRKVGFDFEKEPYGDLAREYVELYYKGRTGGSSLANGAKEVLSLLKVNNIKQVVLSASSYDYLLPQIDEFNIKHYFDEILGISNIYAGSKKEIGCNYMKDENVKNAVLIGDTTHDYEVAKAMGVDCILIPNGHQSRERLLTCGVPVLEGLRQVAERILL